MFRSLNIAATGMTAQETKLDTISNNLANVNTTGYKRQDAEFEDLLYQNLRGATMTASGQAASSGTQVGTGVRIVSTSRFRVTSRKKYTSSIACVVAVTNCTTGSPTARTCMSAAMRRRWLPTSIRHCATSSSSTAARVKMKHATI